MILEFSVGNYLSFNKRVTVSFVASADRARPSNLIQVPGPGALGVARALAVYGANASGKSNLVNALGFMERFVRGSADEAQDREPIPVTPFRLDPEAEQHPSEFEVVIWSEGERYVYGFTVSPERVHEEWLTALRKRQRLLFRRHADGVVEFGSSWRGDRERIANLARRRARSLLLSIAARADNPTAFRVWHWFVTKLWVGPTTGLRAEASLTTKMLSESPETLDSVKAFLQAADVGISGLVLRPVSVARSRYWRELSQSNPELYEALVKRLIRRPSEEGADTFIAVDALHKRSDGEDVAFSFDEEESAGTKQLYSLAYYWIRALNRGHVIVMDELHAKLHPLISRFLIEAFHQGEGQAQIIFTTHDCSLLDADLFRRDQVWFTEKDRSGATDLYSLWDYRPRPDENFRGGYLKGRYGAIPFVGEFQF